MAAICRLLCMASLPFGQDTAHKEGPTYPEDGGHERDDRDHNAHADHKTHLHRNGRERLGRCVCT
eukprot:15231-Eustigmatos_ZCMA.PRE.1